MHVADFTPGFLLLCICVISLGKSSTPILLHVSKQAPVAARAKRATTRWWSGRVDSSAGFPCADPAPALSTFLSALGFNALEALRMFRT